MVTNTFWELQIWKAKRERKWFQFAMNCLQARLTEHHFWLIVKKGYRTKLSIKFLFEVSFRVLGKGPYN